VSLVPHSYRSRKDEDRGRIVVTFEYASGPAPCVLCQPSPFPGDLLPASLPWSALVLSCDHAPVHCAKCVMRRALCIARTVKTDLRPTDKSKRNVTICRDSTSSTLLSMVAKTRCAARVYTSLEPPSPLPLPLPLSHHRDHDSPPAIRDGPRGLSDHMQPYASWPQPPQVKLCRPLTFLCLVELIPPEHVPAWSSRSRVDSAWASFLSPVSSRSEA
jgi:hypothetical protein